MLTQTFLPLLTAGLLLVAPVAALAQQPADNDDAALAYAQCMRDNGYAEFPDPTPGEGMRFLITPGSAARFEKASTACRELAPEGLRDEGVTPEQLEGLVLRQHALPVFQRQDLDERLGDGRQPSFENQRRRRHRRNVAGRRQCPRSRGRDCRPHWRRIRVFGWIRDDIGLRRRWGYWHRYRNFGLHC